MIVIAQDGVLAAVLKGLKFTRGSHVSLTVNAVKFWREPAAATNRETDCMKSGSGGFFSNRIERIEEREEIKSLLFCSWCSSWIF